MTIETNQNTEHDNEQQEQNLTVETQQAESKTDAEDTADQATTMEWQEDTEHLTTDMSTEIERTDAAIGLLLLNSPKGSHIDTEDDELMENALLMPIGGEKHKKQPDIELEIERENHTEDGKTTTSTTTTTKKTPISTEPLNLIMENNKADTDNDSDTTVILETTTPNEVSIMNDKNKANSKAQSDASDKKSKMKNGTLVIRSYKLRRKSDKKQSIKPTATKTSDHKKALELGENISFSKSNSGPATTKYRIKRTKQDGNTYYHFLASAPKSLIRYNT